MKILLWLLGIIVVLFTFIYTITFTSYGNALVLPGIESQILKQTKMNSKLLKYKLSMSDFEILLELNENNTIHVYGNYSLFTKAFNINYEADFKELSTLEPLLGKKLNGTSYSHGNVVGDISNITIVGTSRVAYGNTSYKINLVDLKLKSLVSHTKNLDLASLAIMLGEKAYINARVDVDVNLSNLTRHELLGSLSVVSSHASFNKALVRKHLGISLPKNSSFKFKSTSEFKGDEVLSKIAFTSKLVDLKAKKFTYNLEMKSYESDYKLYIASLNNLYFLTSKKIKGDLSANGVLSYKKHLDISAFCKVADAIVVANLHNTKLVADIKVKETLKTLDKLYYPKIIKASLDARLDFDISNQHGKLKSKIKDGVFNKNKFFKLVKDYAGINMYKEIFVGTLNAKLDKTNYLIDVDLFSDNTAISTKKAKLNTQSKRIDALLNLEAHSNSIDVRLRGDVAKPEIQIQMKNLMINKLLNKYLK